MARRSLTDEAPSVPRRARFFAGVPDGAGFRRRAAGAQEPGHESVCFSALLREVLEASHVRGDASALSKPVGILGRQPV